MELGRSSVTLISYHITTWRHNADDLESSSPGKLKLSHETQIMSFKDLITVLKVTGRPTERDRDAIHMYISLLHTYILRTFRERRNLCRFIYLLKCIIHMFMYVSTNATWMSHSYRKCN